MAGVTIANGQFPVVEFPDACPEELALQFAPDFFLEPVPLSTISIPEPSNLSDFVRDRSAAIALGKALFWDMQVGSDGVQSCASCHFNAGADTRTRNQLHPGRKSPGDGTFNLGGPNYHLKSKDFPLTKLADPNNPIPAIIADSDDVISSQGVFLEQFEEAERGEDSDEGESLSDPVFQVNGINVRRVEPRNTPTMINAVFNLRNFWDGRAFPVFNGVNGLGDRDPNAKVVRAVTPDQLEEVRVRLEFSSLASQAVQPPLSDFEMSYRGRPFVEIGKRLVSAVPLAQQVVDPEDSALGPYARSARGKSKKGLEGTYSDLIEQAFHPAWWRSNKIVKLVNGAPTFIDKSSRKLKRDEYTLMEYNFALFFGLAVQMYEATLISDDAPVDRFLLGDSRAMTAQQQRGMALFDTKGCGNCHQGGEFTNASVRRLVQVAPAGNDQVERMLTGNCQPGLYDQGFYNIGVRPSDEDLGNGGLDALGNPLSEAVRATMGLFLTPNITNPPPQPGERTVVRGTFKVPGLRNVELTAPYFHNGGKLTLKEVVQFYNRGADFRRENFDVVDLGIHFIGMTEEEMDDIVAFLKALTDERVRYHREPFDHPELFVPNGHPGNERQVVPGDGFEASNDFLHILAVGRGGLKKPLPTFEKNLRGD
jgi:cytochrome c peroxidase